MAGQVFYRKWRPQRFADVVGQEYVTQTLLNALGTDRVAHAYLLCGPRGTGKTSTGRIMAKALNCLRNGKGEPCNACSMCEAISEGRAIDLIEIDAASNRGIDEMRSLREKINFAPNEGRYKVYIIDEVHMLTEPAFNALLKTLEEPPPRTVFILATTDAQKLPATVISRCQRFDFRRISLKDVTGRLAKLCQDESIEASPDVLMAVARSAGGSLRDAENIFEQLVVGYGQRLEMAQLRDFLGLGGEREVRALAVAALASDIPAGLKILGSAGVEGLDLRQFHRQLLEYLRALLLLKAGATEAVEQFQDERIEMEVIARDMTLDRLLRAVQIFGKVDLRTNTYSTLPLELALIESAAPSGHPAASGSTSAAPGRTPETRPPPQAPMQPPVPPRPTYQPPPSPALSIGMERVPPSGARGEVQAPPAPPPRAPAPRSDAMRPTQPSPAVRQAPPSAGPPAPRLPAPTAAEQELGAQGDPLSRLKEQWATVIEASKAPGQKIKIDVLLRSGEPISVDEQGVVLAFPYEKFVDMMRQELENPGSRRALEEAFAKVLGQRRSVRCVVQSKQKRPGGHLLKAAMEMGATVIEDEPSSLPSEGRGGGRNS